MIPLLRPRDALRRDRISVPAMHAAESAGSPPLLCDARELERLVLVSMADWLQQAEDVDANGFGGSDRTRQLYWEGGETAGHWHWVEGGVRSFRAEGFSISTELASPSDPITGNDLFVSDDTTCLGLLKEEEGEVVVQVVW